MLGIVPVKYLSIDVDVKTYNRVIRFITVGEGRSEVKVNKFFIKRLQEDNQFARLKCGEYYMDITMKKYVPVKNVIVISFGDLIDSNKISIITKKQSLFYRQPNKKP